MTSQTSESYASPKIFLVLEKKSIGLLRRHTVGLLTTLHDIVYIRPFVALYVQYIAPTKPNYRFNHDQIKLSYHSALLANPRISRITYSVPIMELFDLV